MLPQEVEVKVVAVVVSAPTLGRCAAVDPQLPPTPNKIYHQNYRHICRGVNTAWDYLLKVVGGGGGWRNEICEREKMKNTENIISFSPSLGNKTRGKK